MRVVRRVHQAQAVTVEKVNWSVGGRRVRGQHGTTLHLRDGSFSEAWHRVVARVTFSNGATRVLRVDAYVCHRRYPGTG